jgi:BASS family bile acid:Na+ symporter
MANFYTYLGRGNLALAVVLTAVSCLAAVLSMPPLLALFKNRLQDPAALNAPIPLLIGQLLFLLVLPVVLGMALRRAWPAFPERHGRTLLGLGIAALAALITLVVAQEWERLASGRPPSAFLLPLGGGVLYPGGCGGGTFCPSQSLMVS